MRSIEAMNVDQYKRRLSNLEATLSARVSQKRVAAREQLPDSPVDAADASVSDESGSEDFTEAELDATQLQQVRDALRRIDDGTFGKCVVDGTPIEAKRLEASPWTPYCLKHQQLLEAAEQPRTPTL
jgi:DnaK suppressor protein